MVQLTDLPLYTPKGVMYTELTQASAERGRRHLASAAIITHARANDIRTFRVVFPPCFLFVSSFESGLRDKVRLPGKC